MERVSLINSSVAARGVAGGTITTRRGRPRPRLLFPQGHPSHQLVEHQRQIADVTSSLRRQLGSGVTFTTCALWNANGRLSPDPGRPRG
ncbi:MAG TPA: hypothetical protein V6D03_09175 [Candidatus Caenarcaniphilales bacterium]